MIRVDKTLFLDNLEIVKLDKVLTAVLKHKSERLMETGLYDFVEEMAKGLKKILEEIDN